MAKILTVKELAERLETDARTTRKFLRTVTPRDSHPGKGRQWGIEAKQVRSLQAKFKRFSAEQEAKRAETASTPDDAPIDNSDD